MPCAARFHDTVEWRASGMRKWRPFRTSCGLMGEGAEKGKGGREGVEEGNRGGGPMNGEPKIGEETQERSWRNRRV